MSGVNKKKPVEMVGADSIQEKQRYLQYTIQSMKFSNSFTACFQSNFILSGTSFLSPEIDSKIRGESYFDENVGYRDDLLCDQEPRIPCLLHSYSVTQS